VCKLHRLTSDFIGSPCPRPCQRLSRRRRAPGAHAERTARPVRPAASSRVMATPPVLLDCAQTRTLCAHGVRPTRVPAWACVYVRVRVRAGVPYPAWRTPREPRPPASGAEPAHNEIQKTQQKTQQSKTKTSSASTHGGAGLHVNASAAPHVHTRITRRSARREPHG
jgi:hypothetical protein